jgi:hypothetical protein
MSSRLLIPVLCVAAVVYACGPRSRSDAAGAKKNDASTAQTTVKSSAPRNSARKSSDEKPSFASQLTVNAEPTEVRLAFRIVNTSSKRVEVNFSSGQTYDFVILDSIGREVWHWGSGRMFTQTLRNRLLDGGESLDVNETWKTDALAPGRYTARGVLTSQNYPLTQTTEFTVGEVTVAAKEDP